MKNIFNCHILTLLIAFVLLCGCGANDTKAAGAASEEATIQITDRHSDDGRTVVGISMPDKLLERWNKDGSYLKEVFEKAGFEVYLSYSNNLIDTQINSIREMIENGADLLVITAVDGAALGPVLDEAKAANINVIAYDRLIMNSDVVDYYVSYDNYMVGQLQANFIITSLGLNYNQEPKYMEFVSGDPVDNNSRYFYKGAMDTLEPYLENGSVRVLSGQTDFYVTSTAQWSSDLAQQRLQIILTSYYPENTRLDAVLCANDSTALGAARALESDYKMDNKVVVTGQDADIPNIYNMIEGVQSMTVFKALDKETIVTAALAKSILDGNTPDESLINESNWDFECSYNTTDYHNGAKLVNSYLLTPIVIIPDNLEKKLFDSGYYKRNSAGMIYSAK